MEPLSPAGLPSLGGKGHCPGAPARPEKEWTMLVYGALDNNLDKYAGAELTDLQGLDSLGKINLVVQWDRGKRTEKTEAPWQGCRRFLVAPHSEGKSASSTVIQDLGQMNMADPKNLADFVSWGMKNFPAAHTMIVLKNHGHAWEGLLDDESHKDRMSLKELSTALQDAEKATGKKPDILAFDACGMANAEVLVEMKDRAGYLVGSEKVLYLPGFPYKEALSLKEDDQEFTISPAGLTQRLMEGARSRPENIDSFSAFDLSKTDAFVTALENFSQAVVHDRQDRPAIRALLNYEDQSFPNNIDLPAFLEKIAADPQIQSQKLKGSAEALKKSLNAMMIDEFHNPIYPVGGVSIANKYAVFNQDFLDSELSEKTSWPAALRSGFTPGGPSALYATWTRFVHSLKKILG